MNAKKLFSFLVLIAVAGLLSGCAGQPAATETPPFQAQSLAQGNWKLKADNLVFVLDASSSMAEGYNGIQKFATARGVVGNFNQTMPDLNLKAALRSFGHDPGLSRKSTMLVYGMTNWSRAAMAEALGKVQPPGGPSPMEKSFLSVADDLSATQGKIAMVVVSDGKDMGKEPLVAANALKAQFGDRLCIYTVLVGDNEAGRNLLSELSKVTGCGSMVSADNLATGPQMADFVKEVLLEAVPTPLPPMSERKTWVFKDIKFEFDKATLMKSSYPILDNIYTILSDHPEIKTVEIQGHTCSIGTEAYNLDLSQRRAHTVMKYLQDKGIDPARMTAKGYGESQPMESNKTKQGRSNNRRVELKPVMN